jgi:hypothetical protein
MPQKHTIMLKIAYINTYISGISQIKQDSLLGPMHIRVAPYQNGLDFERKKNTRLHPAEHSAKMVKFVEIDEISLVVGPFQRIMKL